MANDILIIKVKYFTLFMAFMYKKCNLQLK